jgi:hypothetical protein
VRPPRRGCGGRSTASTSARCLRASGRPSSSSTPATTRCSLLDQARRLAAGIPGAELLVLESNNHAPLPQDPAWRELVAAIRSHCGGA